MNAHHQLGAIVHKSQSLPQAYSRGYVSKLVECRMQSVHKARGSVSQGKEQGQTSQSVRPGESREHTKFHLGGVRNNELCESTWIGGSEP